MSEDSSGPASLKVRVGQIRTTLFIAERVSASLLMCRLPLPFLGGRDGCNAHRYRSIGHYGHLLMRQKSMAEPATFRWDMDQSRRAIRASRELLKRLVNVVATWREAGKMATRLLLPSPRFKPTFSALHSEP
ncbi:MULTISPECIES: hypothetical protein [unclassified Mesorhizobium]|uniref:hypothetical protein n=1 Tax=unclassified Mesorhizobium TaxID=325217 RepID=UPI0033377965